MRSRNPVLRLVLFVTALHSVATAPFADPPRDTVRVCSEAEASVFVDGHHEGPAPLSVELSADMQHSIVLVIEGCAPVERFVEPVVRWSLLAPAAANGIGFGMGAALLDLATGQARGLEPNEIHVAREELVPLGETGTPDLRAKRARLAEPRAGA